MEYFWSILRIMRWESHCNPICSDVYCILELLIQEGYYESIRLFKSIDKGTKH